MTRLVLASASPRRSQLLHDAGYEFEVDPADVDETPLPAEPAADYVERLARAKAELVAARHPGATALGADTVVVLDGELLGKPADDADAIAVLERLSGRGHEVLTGVAVCRDGMTTSAVDTTEVRFRTLDRAEIEAYVRTGEPRDKAGSYAIQGGAGAFVAATNGAFDNVVGLPVALVRRLLEQAGVSERS
ncbi:MAG: Maf family protein [Acidimicrobiales bacterium]